MKEPTAPTRILKPGRAGGGGCARARGGRRGGEGRPSGGGQLEPTYTFMAENAG